VPNEVLGAGLQPELFVDSLHAILGQVDAHHR
jgi:hypothetical protein